MTSNSDIAYIAGLFDGEGSVDYAKRKKGWDILMRIQMTDEDVLDTILLSHSFD